VLELFRRNLKNLKWVLWLIILSFVLFFGVTWWAPSGNQGTPWVAEVNGEEVPFRMWQIQARQMDERYRQTFGAQYEQLRDQINPRAQAAEQLIDRTLMVQDAKRLGLGVSDGELATAIRDNPSFQENGQFVGSERYQNFVVRATPYGSVEVFESMMREDLLLEKWRELIASGAFVSRSEIEQEFRRRHERVRMEYVALPYEEIEAETDPSDAELQAWYQARRDQYAVGEARRASYVLVDQGAVGEQIEISDEQIRTYYEENSQQFTRPEQRRARHILIKAGSAASEEQIEQARAEAEALLERLRGGADFADLARQHSEDQGSAEKGGDLGWFPRGRMVPEFEEAVFSMEPGELAGPVRTNYGFHVIRLEEVREAGVQPLEDVRDQIRSQLRFPELREAQQELATQIASEATDEESLRQAAESRNLEVRQTQLISRRGSIEELGPAPEMIETMFSLEPQTVSEPVSLPRGEIVLAVTEVVEDHLPPLAENRTTVLADYREEKAREEAQRRLEQAIIDSGEDLAQAARKLDTELRETDPELVRGQELPGVGVDPAIERAAFSAEPGLVVGPVAGGTAAVALRVLDRQEADLERLTEDAPAIRQSLRAPRAQQLLSNRINALREGAEIRRNADLLSPPPASAG
jgi:peptidyl-prolyl cis-trans isomerase D